MVPSKNHRLTAGNLLICHETSFNAFWYERWRAVSGNTLDNLAIGACQNETALREEEDGYKLLVDLMQRVIGIYRPVVSEDAWLSVVRSRV